MSIEEKIAELERWATTHTIQEKHDSHVRGPFITPKQAYEDGKIYAARKALEIIKSLQNDIELLKVYSKGLLMGADSIREENQKLKEKLEIATEALMEIQLAVDNENPSHETIWRIAYEVTNKSQKQNDI